MLSELEKIEHRRAACQRWRAKNREKTRRDAKVYADAHRERHRETARNWNANNKERAKENKLRYLLQNPGVQREQNLAYMARNPGKHLKKYGISFVEFQQKCNAQGNICPICQDKKKLVVDHDHTSGKFRGLLCGTCNSGIGLLQDSFSTIIRAADYIRRTKLCSP
jgi:hypothetical protein